MSPHLAGTRDPERERRGLGLACAPGSFIWAARPLLATCQAPSGTGLPWDSHSHGSQTTAPSPGVGGAARRAGHRGPCARRGRAVWAVSRVWRAGALHADRGPPGEPWAGEAGRWAPRPRPRRGRAPGRIPGEGRRGWSGHAGSGLCLKALWPLRGDRNVGGESPRPWGRPAPPWGGRAASYGLFPPPEMPFALAEAADREGGWAPSISPSLATVLWAHHGPGWPEGPPPPGSPP